MPLNVLTDDDLKILKLLIQQQKDTRVGTPTGDRTGGLDNDYQPPEVYIAVPPSTGIPALRSGSQSGTDVVTTPLAGDIPGVASCTIFSIINGVMQKTSITQQVYNLSYSKITQAWILVKRDKFGKWVVSPPSSAIRRGKLATTLTTGSRNFVNTAELELWDFDGTQWDQTDTFVTIHDDGMLCTTASPLPIDTWVQIALINGSWFYDGHNCSPLAAGTGAGS